MSSNDIHGIQDGWEVKTHDGHSIGSVEETTHTYIRVKSGILNAAHRYLPATALAHVRPEMKEISVSLTKDEVEAGDWSQPPLEPPRTDGTPLNEEDYDEVDRVTAGVPRDPERPTNI